MSFKEIHGKNKASLPSNKTEREKLISFLKFRSCANPDDAKAIRQLLRELRKTKSKTNVGNANETSQPITQIPEEIKWFDLDWKFDYAGGINALEKKFPDKPIFLELTNKYN